MLACASAPSLDLRLVRKDFRNGSLFYKVLWKCFFLSKITVHSCSLSFASVVQVTVNKSHCLDKLRVTMPVKPRFLPSPLMLYTLSL